MRRRVKASLIVVITIITLIPSTRFYLSTWPLIDISGSKALWGGATRFDIYLRNVGPFTVAIGPVTITAEGGKRIKIHSYDRGGSVLIDGDPYLMRATCAIFNATKGVYTEGGYLYLTAGVKTWLGVMVSNKTAFIPGRAYRISIEYFMGFARFEREVKVQDSGMEFPIFHVYFAFDKIDPEIGDAGPEAVRMKHGLDRYSLTYSVGFLITLGSPDLDRWGNGTGFDIMASFNTFHIGKEMPMNNFDIRPWVKAGGIAFAWHYAFDESAVAMREVFGIYFTRDWHAGIHVIKIVEPESPFARGVPEEFKLFEEDTMLLDPMSNPTVVMIAVDTYRMRPYFTVARYGEGWAFGFQTHQGNDNPTPIETMVYTALVESLASRRPITPYRKP